MTERSKRFKEKKVDKGISLFKRYIFLIAGLTIMAFGVAFSIKAELGTSPISSLPYVTSLMSGLTVGNTTIILHCVLITLQILVLRKDYEVVQLLQLPVAFIFGYLTDFAVYVVQNLECGTYFTELIFCAIGIVLVGIGVSIEVAADVVVLAGEGFVLAVCKAGNLQFPKIKIAFDTSLVVISVILSLLFLEGLYGVREGTVLAALCVGIVAKLFSKPMSDFVKLL